MCLLTEVVIEESDNSGDYERFCQSSRDQSGEKELHIAFPLFHSAVAVFYVDQSATSQFFKFIREENILLGPIGE
jgi:hypothetical protein